jgi:hypothetical protein
MTMKKFAALCAAAACMAMANPALASSFSPAGGTVTATGATSLTALGFVRLNCAATFQGTVNADGTATITSASFVGGPFGACSGVKLTTPFTLTADTTTQVTVHGLQVTAPIPCGPADLTASWTNGSPSHFDIPTASVNPGGCTVTATLTVSGITII